MIVRVVISPWKTAFRYPLRQTPRTAVLVPWFGERRRAEVRIFGSGWCAEAAAFAPAALAGTREQLLALGANGTSPRLTHALVVLEPPGGALPTAADRERLWRAFRVPVFVQMVGPHGELLAAECEAHDGLHIERPGWDWSGYAAETAPCPCGRDAARIISARERIVACGS